MDRVTTLARAEGLGLPEPARRPVVVALPCFAEIYEQGFPFVWRSLRSMGVPEQALRDAAQDVFLVVHRRLDTFNGTSAIKTWLFGITLRVARDHRRAARRKAAHSAPPPPFASERDPLDAAVAHQPSPVEQLEAAEASRVLLRLLDELDEDRRAVFVLTELEQMSAPQIAEALGLNVNTVYGRLRAARQEFNAALERHQARERHAQRRDP